MGTVHSGPSPARAGDRGVGGDGGSKLTLGAPRDRTCAVAARETGARRLRIPCRLGGGACAVGAGGAARARRGLGWWWDVQGRPRSASALEGGDGAGPRRGSANAKGKLCTGGGGTGCGSGAAGRPGEAREGGEKPASRRRRWGARRPRGERGEEPPGLEVGGRAEPKLRARQVGARPGLSGVPNPPGPPRASPGGRGEKEGGVMKERMRRGLERGPGVTHRLSRGRRSACPPQAAGAAALSPLPPPPRGPTPATATRAGARARAGAGAGAAASAAAAATAPAPAPAARPRPRPCPCRARPRRRPSPRAL